MLAELWHWLATPCAARMRRLGYVRESVAIAARHRRCDKAWQPHLRNTRRAVLEATNALERRRTALILGSGKLLDIPLRELSSSFQRVVLVDVLHPRSSRRLAHALPNVELIEHDLSECTDGILALPAEADERALSRLSRRGPTRFLDDASIDYVASVNLLSQLPLTPCRWLLKHRPRLPEATVNDFALALMQRHLDYLAAFDATVCLIADAEQITHGADGRVQECTDLATHFRLDRQAFRSWWWDIAPRGELPDGAYARHRVVACRL